MIAKEFEDKKGDLQPKVLEVYEASSTEVKVLNQPDHDLDLNVITYSFFFYYLFFNTGSREGS